MDQQTMMMLVVIAVIAVLALAGAVLYSHRRRRAQLRARFGPEYDHAVEQHGNVQRAEAELAKREARVSKLHLRPLEPENARRYAEAWRRTQARFVDDPKGAVTEADKLVGEVMAARGYPLGDVEERAADLSVDHPRVVYNYREAHAIALRHSRGEATTEDLRQAFVHYRELFEDLLGAPEPVREMAGGRR